MTENSVNYLINILSERKDTNLMKVIVIISKSLGFYVSTLYHKLSTLMFDDKKYRLQCKFFINCRFYNLIPVHIQNNFMNIENIHMFSKSRYNILKNNLQKAKKKILNVEILDINNYKHTKFEIRPNPFQSRWSAYAYVTDHFGIKVFMFFSKNYLTRIFLFFFFYYQNFYLENSYLEKNLSM